MQEIYVVVSFRRTGKRFPIPCAKGRGGGGGGGVETNSLGAMCHLAFEAHAFHRESKASTSHACPLGPDLITDPPSKTVIAAHEVWASVSRSVVRERERAPSSAWKRSRTLWIARVFLSGRTAELFRMLWEGAAPKITSRKLLLICTEW
jgi:hypothetical protein